MTTLPRRLLAAHAAVAAVGLASMIAAAVVLARIGAVDGDLWLAVAVWSLLALSGASLLFLIFAVRRVASELAQQVQRVTDLAEASHAADGAPGDTIALAEFEQLGSAVLRASARLSARREAVEADLAGERRRLAAMVRTLPIGLVIVDAGGRVAMCNAAAVGHVAAIDAAVPCTVGEALPPTLASHLADDAAASRHGPREVLTPDSSVLEVFEHALDQSGDRLLVLRDVTAERTLAQRRTQFLLRTAHELRTPLASLSMAISLLRARREIVPAAAAGQLDVGETAHESVQRLTHLTERLLRWGGLTLQQPNASPPRVAWETLANAVAQRGESWARRYAKPVSFTADSTGAHVATVSEHLLALLDELLDNAFRAARALGGVELGMHQRDGWLVLSVRDHGAGMSAAARATWQSPLACAGPRPGDGAGLGLAIAAELARVIGADLQLAPAREGSGTRFDIRIPLDDANRPTTLTAHRTDAANAPRLEALGTPREPPAPRLDASAGGWHGN